MFLRTAIVTSTAAAAIVLGAGASWAAPAPAAPPLAGTTQTLTLRSGGTSTSSTIVFATSRWHLQGSGASGQWVTVGAKFGSSTYSKVDHGCGYSGTYSASKGMYVGRFACQTSGPSGTFTLTT